MKFTSSVQEKAYKQAMKRKYKAAAFDIDGTLTHFARFLVPHSLSRKLDALTKNIPVAICTGRPLEYIRGELGHIVHQKNAFVFCENGSIGYRYDPKTEDFKKILEIPWPHRAIKKDAMAAFLKDRFGWRIHIKHYKHTLVVIYPEWIYTFPKFARKVSARAAKDARKLLKEMDMHEHFTIRDSGIGLIVLPSNSGKGPAMQAWAKHLKIPVRSILTIGDQAGPGENDEDFLNGKNGTAFTVGKQTKNTWPLPVLENSGLSKSGSFKSNPRKIWGPEGTESLLEQVKFA
jgi:HAD superfamily hydrolase (TIGR01484 family)